MHTTGMYDALDRSGTTVKFLMCVAVFFIAALPLASVENLPLIDYPEHLAAFHILHNYNTSEHLQAYYAIREGLYPYWGIRSTMSVLVPVFGVEGGMKAFAVLAMLMPAAGACVLGWTLAGRITLLPLASLLFVYNDVLHWGFLNFLFSAGIAMFCFAAWVGSKEQPAFPRFSLLIVAAIVLIWMHPLASCMLGLMVGLWEMANWVQNARKPGQGQRLLFVIVAGLCFVPALASLISLTSFDGSNGGYLHMGELSDRLWIAFSPFWLGMGSAVNLAAGLAALSAICLWLRSGSLSVSNNVPRFVVYFLIAAYVAPFVVFGVFYVNLRLPLFACLCFAAGLQMSEQNRGRRPVLYGALALLLAVKLATSAIALTDGSQRVSELRAALDEIPLGAKVLQVINRNAPSYPGMLEEADYQNLGSYLIVDRDAFIPDIFGSVEVTHSQAVADMSAPMTIPPGFSLLETPETEWAPQYRIFAKHAKDWRSDYDYLLVIDFGAAQDNPKGTTTVAQGSYFSILKIGD